MLNRPKSRTYSTFMKEVEEHKETKFLEQLEKYVDQYRQELLELHEGDIYEDKYSDIDTTILKTESPIERLLFISLKHLLKMECGELMHLVIPQLVTKDDKYRVDFYVNIAEPDLRVSADVLVEVDGHEFHEKTKEQAAEDKKRDRDLTKEFGRVITFTGSEVYNDSLQCAREIILLLRADIIGQVRSNK